MIDFIELHPVGRSSLELNTLAYPIVDSFEPEVEMDEHKYKKALVMGEWPAYHPEGALYVTINGDIVGNLGADYTAKRDALVLACKPFTDADELLTTRHHGTMHLQLTGWAAVATQDYVITSKSFPMTTDYVSVSSFHITFKFPIPYFLNGSTRYYIA
jgi:hypothetical protein